MKFKFRPCFQWPYFKRRCGALGHPKKTHITYEYEYEILKWVLFDFLNVISYAAVFRMQRITYKYFFIIFAFYWRHCAMFVGCLSPLVAEMWLSLWFIGILFSRPSCENSFVETKIWITIGSAVWRRSVISFSHFS